MLSVIKNVCNKCNFLTHQNSLRFYELGLTQWILPFYHREVWHLEDSTLMQNCKRFLPLTILLHELVCMPIHRIFYDGYFSSGLLHSFASGLSCSILLLYDPISLPFHLLLISPTLILHNILDEERALTLKTCSLLILLEWIPLLVDFELLPSWLRWYIIFLFHLSNGPSYLIMIIFFLICDTELTSFLSLNKGWFSTGARPQAIPELWLRDWAKNRGYTAFLLSLTSFTFLSCLL